MKMILRWFPNGDDSVTLSQIRQTPGISGIATCLPYIPVGEVWPREELASLRDEVHAAGLEMEVIESVNIHEDIKKGLPSRDALIENYQQTIRNLSGVGVKCLCYNFMPVMDWIRSDVSLPLADGSYGMSYRHDQVLRMNPSSLSGSLFGKARGFSMPGWEPERVSQMADDIAFYQQMDEADYWKNMQYFLNAVIPVAEEAGILMAIHPDDPPWPLFGLPKLITNRDNIRTFLSLHDSPNNGLTFCTGSLGSLTDNDLPSMAREFAQANRIAFAHIRNVRHTGTNDYDECAHPSEYGDLDMFAIVRSLYEGGFDGYIRPDHGRMIWGEQARPGYGLYDRALGATYLHGLWEAITHFN